ncbi:DSS1/SEM1 protein [Vigna unguiculata]|uniref:DSS1/SEM1 protein n=1 Tax=Vigna unguiculata TaxID=3917 RepID=A0A4D6MDU3_VIGUN|nr:DSS1/SEM1 protein [Vigna unguiculata]
MATEPKAATEDVKIDLFEDDDEFEEFEINEVYNCEQRIYSLLPPLWFISIACAQPCLSVPFLQFSLLLCSVVLVPRLLCAI